MSGRRRVQRSVRTTLATALVVVAAVLVAVAVAVGSAVVTTLAALTSVLLGGSAVRVMYAEVVQTRLESARGRADQARAFGASLAATQARHTAERTQLSSRLASRDRMVVDLTGRIVVADARADRSAARADQAEARAARAEARATDQAARADREHERADDAQGRLSALLDEVLAYQVTPLEPYEEVESRSDDLPSVVDLLAWEERSSAATAPRNVRKHA